MLKKLLPAALTLITALTSITSNYAQAPVLGTASNFVLFSSNGAVSNSGSSQITGNVGTNNGSSTAFGNVNGVMHDNDAASAKASADVLIAYNQLNGRTATMFPTALLGNGQTLFAGVYAINEAATLNLGLTLDAKNDPNAVFIFKIKGSFSTNASSKVILKNGALACNVFWKTEGLVSMATGTTMRGTIIANNAAINISVGDTLEGRAFSTTGAVTIQGSLAYTPIGCGSAVLTGPKAPEMGTTSCYALFSAKGAVSNTGITHVLGDVGSNSGAVTGYDPLTVTGKIHLTPDNSTAQCSTDLYVAYNYLNVLPHEIELLYPAQFGNNLVLTPHTYLLGSATALTGTVYLNAQGNANAVFVIKINGALTTGTYAKVVLINGAQAKNVYWKVEGAVGINNYSVFAGTIICNNGALGALNTGVVLDGKAFTTTGSITTAAISTTMPVACTTTGINSAEIENNNRITLTPNPFSSAITININETNMVNGEVSLYNVSGDEVLRNGISGKAFVIETANLTSGIYFYKISSNGNTIQTGRLVSQQ